MFFIQPQLLSVIAPKKGSTDFRWTDDKLEFLLKCCANFRSQKEYQGINCERNKNEQIKYIFIDWYPMEKEILKDFTTGLKWRKFPLKTKVKIIRSDFRKAVDSGKTVVVGVLFLRFIAYAKVFGEATRQLIVF